MFIKALDKKHFYDCESYEEWFEQAREYYLNSISILMIDIVKDKDGKIYGANLRTNKGEYYVPVSFTDDYPKIEKLIKDE